MSENIKIIEESEIFKVLKLSSSSSEEREHLVCVTQSDTEESSSLLIAFLQSNTQRPPVITANLLKSLKLENPVITSSGRLLHKESSSDKIIYCRDCQSVVYGKALGFFNLDSCQCVVCQSNKLELV